MQAVDLPGCKQGVAVSNRNAESSGCLGDTTSMEACDFFECMAIVEFVLTVRHQDGHMDQKMPPWANMTTTTLSTS